MPFGLQMGVRINPTTQELACGTFVVDIALLSAFQVCSEVGDQKSSGSGVGEKRVASSIQLVPYLNRSQLDVTGRRIDVGEANQLL